MALWQRLAHGIDRLNGWIGSAVAWLTLATVLIGALNAFARYAGRFIGVNLSRNAYIELQWYLFSAVFLLGAAWALREDAHVRVDVLFARLSERGQAWINLLGTLFLLLPFCSFALWVSWPSVRNSWLVREGSPDPGGLPRWPLKSLVIVCFVLLLLQGMAELFKQIARLRGDPVAAASSAEPHVEGV